MYEMEDKDLVCKFIVFDSLFTFLEGELKALERSTLKIKKPHLDFVHSKISLVQKEFKSLQNELRKNGIKIYESTDDGFCISYQISCRGYVTQQPMWKAVLKNRVVEQLKSLYQN